MRSTRFAAGFFSGANQRRRAAKLAAPTHRCLRRARAQLVEDDQRSLAGVWLEVVQTDRAAGCLMPAARARPAASGLSVNTAENPGDAGGQSPPPHSHRLLIAGWPAARAFH